MKIKSQIEVVRPPLKVTIELNEREALLLALFLGRHSRNDVMCTFYGISDKSIKEMFYTDESIEGITDGDITNLLEMYAKIKNEFVQARF